MDALPRGLGHAGETADTILDVQFTEVDNLYLSSFFPHALDEMVHHHFGSAFTTLSQAGINRQYFHHLLLALDS
jgi:hypothetical protein